MSLLNLSKIEVDLSVCDIHKAMMMMMTHPPSLTFMISLCYMMLKEQGTIHNEYLPSCIKSS